MRSPANSLSSAANSFEAGLRDNTRSRRQARMKKITRMRGRGSFWATRAPAMDRLGCLFFILLSPTESLSLEEEKLLLLFRFC